MISWATELLTVFRQKANYSQVGRVAKKADGGLATGHGSGRLEAEELQKSVSHCPSDKSKAPSQASSLPWASQPRETCGEAGRGPRSTSALP